MTHFIKVKSRQSGHSSRARDPFYQSKTWKMFRKGYFARHPFCVDCQEEGRNVFAVVLDHIHQRSKGGENFPPDSGLRGLCVHHDAVRQANQSKG